MADQQWDIFAALPQRWRADGENIQPVEKVTSKFALSDTFRQVAVRRCHHPHLHLDRVVAPQTFELLILEHAQQLGLEFGRNLTDLVKKQRSPVCQLDPPDLAADGAGEGAFLMPEQFALKQAGGDGGAVDFDKGSILKEAHTMDRVGHEFLAGPGFSQNQYGRFTGGHGRYLVEDLLERSTVSDDLGKLPFDSGFALKVSAFLPAAA